MIVQRSTIFEWFQIEALRAAYYAERGEPVARRPPGTHWTIVREGERVLACASHLETEGGRLMQDYYCVKGTVGIRALRMLRDAIYAAADADRVKLIVTCEPGNEPMLRAYGWTLTLTPTRHGQGLIPKAVIMTREPKEVG